MFYTAQHDTFSIEVNKPFPSGLWGRSKLILVHDVNSILDNKYVRTNILLILFAAVICCTNQVPSSLSDQEQSTLPTHPDLNWHQNTTFSAAAIYGTMMNTEEKYNWAPSQKYLWNRWNMAMVKYRNVAILDRAWPLSNLFVSLFQYRLFPVAIQGRSRFLCTVSLKKHVLLPPMPSATVHRLAFCHSNCSLPKISSIYHITQATCTQTLKTPSSGQKARDTSRESK